MGIVTSKIVKTAKTYNVTERAQKVISKQKPTPAPSYPSTAKQIEIADQIDPQFMDNHYKQDPVFQDRLKQIFVTSNVQFANDQQKSEKSLPQNTKGSKEWDYGFWEPEKAQEGKVLLKDALKFMADNITDPELNNAKTIAKQYKLNQKDVENILEYYRVFHIIVTPEEARPGYIQPPKFAQFLGKNSSK
ncbi:protein NDUFAF4 homolog [Fopius arisanus]|uniref:Protein NDUFAF4 homolog n=1 Tax=Fopius arisanus TaxID=64838 RepID=A0A9R1TCB6_9HYME|nr:PREDICTED: protein NDUFAF4 homolog [Fopius arisanus]